MVSAMSVETLTSNRMPSFCVDFVMSATTTLSTTPPPLFTDDDRRELPALYHQYQQGGSWKSKHLEDFEIVYEDCTEFPTFLPGVIDQAHVNFAKCWSLPFEAVDKKLILQKSSSLGIAGWSGPDLTVRDNGLIDSERRMRKRQERSLGGSDCR